MSDPEMQIETVASSLQESEELYLGDAIHFFLSAKRAGGRSERTVDDYHKKLELFGRWVAVRYGAARGTEEVDAPYLYIGPNEVEAYVVYLKDGRGIAESSRRTTLPYYGASSRPSQGD